jgi:hypothetical protein
MVAGDCTPVSAFGAIWPLSHLIAVVLRWLEFNFGVAVGTLVFALSAPPRDYSAPRLNGATANYVFGSGYLKD